MKFRPGDRVKLHPNSEYYYQAREIIGRIRDIQSNDWIGVDFVNGYQNEYHVPDLILLDKFIKVIKPYPIVAFLNGGVK